MLPFLVLDPPDGLNLRSLGMGAKLAITLVLSTTAVTLHDELVAAVSGVLVAHKAINIKEKNAYTYILFIEKNLVKVLQCQLQSFEANSKV